MNNSINTKEYNQYAPNNDYVTLKNYNHSFYNRVLTSQLRMAIAPGTVKYMRDIISSDNVLQQMKAEENNPNNLLSENNANVYDSNGFVKINQYQLPQRREGTTIWTSKPTSYDEEYVVMK